VNSDLINENKCVQYKNNTFEDETRINDQYTLHTELTVQS